MDNNYITIDKIGESETEYDFITVEMAKEPYSIITLTCQTCGADIEYHKHPFPICSNCLKILKNIIATDKSNWNPK